MLNRQKIVLYLFTLKPQNIFVSNKENISNSVSGFIICSNIVMHKERNSNQRAS